MGVCWLSWYETPRGYMVQMSADRYYHYVTIDAIGDFVQLPQKAGKGRTDSVPVRPYEDPVIRAALVKKVLAYNRAADKNRVRFLANLGVSIGSYSGSAIPRPLYRDAINAAIDSSWNVLQDMHIVILAGSTNNHFDNNWYGVAAATSPRPKRRWYGNPIRWPPRPTLPGQTLRW